MRCIKCRKQTPDTELYCRHCGTRMDMSFDEITEELRQEINKEHEQDTEAFFRWIMFILLFIWVSGLFFNRLWENPPIPTETPAYIPNLEIPASWSEIRAPLVIPEQN